MKLASSPSTLSRASTQHRSFLYTDPCMEPGVGMCIFSITLLNTALQLMPSICVGMVTARARKLRWTRIADYVEDVANAVRQLPSPPILIGHSMVGFII